MRVLVMLNAPDTGFSADFVGFAVSPRGHEFAADLEGRPR
jgi:hypothetical protein